MILYIVRHGNTFDKGDIVTRVGGLTDIPLSKSGQSQAMRLAEAFEKISLERGYSSPLLRTMQTAEAICKTHKLDIEPAGFLKEVDYGPDENKPEIDVIERLGEQAIQDWDEKSIVPDGWNIEPQTYIEAWSRFIDTLSAETTLVVTSNGVARFLLDALKLTAPNRKLPTGSVGRLQKLEGQWSLDYWGVRPPLP